MKEFYNSLKTLFEKYGLKMANYGEYSFTNEERNAVVTLETMNEVEPLFGIYETTFQISFINGETWENNSALLSDALSSCIPVEDRPENIDLPDNTSILKILETPEFSDIETTFDDENGDETHSVSVSIFWEK